MDGGARSVAVQGARCPWSARLRWLCRGSAASLPPKFGCRVSRFGVSGGLCRGVATDRGQRCRPADAAGGSRRPRSRRLLVLRSSSAGKLGAGNDPRPRDPDQRQRGSFPVSMVGSDRRRHYDNRIRDTGHAPSLRLRDSVGRLRLVGDVRHEDSLTRTPMSGRARAEGQNFRDARSDREMAAPEDRSRSGRTALWSRVIAERIATSRRSAGSVIEPPKHGVWMASRWRQSGVDGPVSAAGTRW